MIADSTRRIIAAGPAVHDVDLDLAGSMSLERFEELAPGAALPAVHRADHGVTSAAGTCIARFAALEADVSSADLNGVGRVSSARFPRLGGVLHVRIAPESRAATLLRVGAERTIRAGYEAALATDQVKDVPLRFVDADELWDEFLPASYHAPRTVAMTAWNVCRFDEFWVNLLVGLGFAGDANRFAKGHVSPLSRSIRGLSTVGVALALTERGGRYHRLVAGGRGVGGHRRERRNLPPEPRKVIDDAG